MQKASGIYNRKGMLRNVLAFCGALRKAGTDVTTGVVLDACNSLKYIDISNKQDFYSALKANLVNDIGDVERFDHLFELFWRLNRGDEELVIFEKIEEKRDGDGSGVELEDERKDGKFRIEEWDTDVEPGVELEEKTVATYSPDEVLATKDFCEITGDEVKIVQRLLSKIVLKLATVKSRRWEISPRGHDTDLRRTLRRNMVKYGGDIVELVRRRRKTRKIKLVLLCDVSGSMDCYSKFLIQFVYSLQNQLSGVETFVFSTRLTRTTPFLKGKKPYDALTALAGSVRDWSGGTRIGDCLQTFNDGYGRNMDRRTVVIIVSDGWDTGDTALVTKEMQRLRMTCRKIIWLNPLLGSPTYEPLTKGMQAALPFVDYFLPAHNLESLVTLGKRMKYLAM